MNWDEEWMNTSLFKLYPYQKEIVEYFMGEPERKRRQEDNIIWLFEYED